jgi:hypothetical protein
MKVDEAYDYQSSATADTEYLLSDWIGYDDL